MNAVRAILDRLKAERRWTIALAFAAAALIALAQMTLAPKSLDVPPAVDTPLEISG